MRDSLPRTMADGDKYWATKFNETYILYEYVNKTTFKKDVSARNYTLPFALKVGLLLGKEVLFGNMLNDALCNSSRKTF